MKTSRLLFNDEMARAIVQGRKTVTRRPCRDQYPDNGSRYVGRLLRLLPPCAPGDLLIGRECWAPCVNVSDETGEQTSVRTAVGRHTFIAYRADDPGPLPGGWHPSIHMPDWAARIRRRVISVTVERLQDITEEDALREGMHPAPGSDGRFLSPLRHRPNVSAEVHNARQAFRLAWGAIYAAKGLGWTVNPWVWRIEFCAENEP